VNLEVLANSLGIKYPEYLNTITTFLHVPFLIVREVAIMDPTGIVDKHQVASHDFLGFRATGGILSALDK
jgi:hypothetical protein